MLFVWYKVSFDEKWSHGSAVCETVYFFVEFVCVFPWKCVSLNNQNRPSAIISRIFMRPLRLD